MTILFLAMAPAVRAQSQPEDQDQNQDQAQGAEQLLPADEQQDSHARIVRISYVDGEVRIDRGQGYESATMNIPITEHNWLQTRSSGWAEVQLEDGSLIRMAPDTVMAFTELTRRSSGGTITTVDLDQGEAEFKITKHGDSEFQVTVKNKTIVLSHSGSFRVTSINSNPLEIAVWKGEVAVRDPESGGEVAVKKNETFALDAMDVARYALDKGAQADQLDEWSKQRDDALSAYASASHGGFQSPYQYGTGDLGYYGEYFDAPGYGTVWQPSGVNLGWDPFNNGYWSYAPGFGYTWVSSYPWGWLPYRYGNWVYVNHRGWCWAPGGWNRWHNGPRWVNAPPGFRPPLPPANNRVVVGGSPGRVIRPGTSRDRGGVHNPGPGGRAGNRDGDNHGGARAPRVFTNDDIQTRVPRTDRPPAQPPASGVVDADRRPRVVEQQPAAGGGTRQPDADRFRGDRAPEGNHRIESSPPAVRSRISNSPPQPQPVAPPASQPVRQYTPPQQTAPIHQSAPPPSAPPAPVVHQSAPSAPVRQSASPESHSSANEGARSGRPK
ncbi:MAG TPA: FecR family protein [Candidatus Sulfotelmatobacter sp.]|nr:FecR family protein [Candidatus Sulfotelmatobacter sp.]